MTLKRITLQLARNPGITEGDTRIGYFITAPLREDGHLDVDGWREHRKECHVVRFHPDPDEHARGLLTHRGTHWMFHYDDEDADDDEAGFRLGDHIFTEGEYVTIASHGETPLTYKITDVTDIASL
ncbi:MAG: hypothetical protein R3C00_00230 [Hyphomonas sp.]|nr:hypothetical protein [Hyphomonas sp.]MCA8903808.1 hypothetical protein [Hyphomonas sp.]MCB9972119.1 hypothetical protein [Hyphomonas sp.]